MNEKVEIFNQSIGYEKYFIEESIKQLGALKIIHNRNIEFKNHSYKCHKMSFEERIGQNEVKSYIVNNLLPLILTSSFKILDMFIELIIKENTEEFIWRFKDKIKNLNKNLDKYDMPENFDEKEVKIIYLIYKKLNKYRSKLIHGKWGSVVDKNIIFQIEEEKFKIEFEKIISIASIACYIVDIINSNKISTSLKINKTLLRYNLNQVVDLLNEEIDEFEEVRILDYKIDYVISEEENSYISLKNIRNSIESDMNDIEKMSEKFKFDYVYTIRVFYGNNVWKIPSSIIKDHNIILQLKELEEFKI